MGNEDKLVNIVVSRWNEANDVERELLIEIMKTSHNSEWSKYVFAAEKGGTVGSELILKYKNEIMNSANEGVTSADIKINHDPEYYRREANALINYSGYLAMKSAS